MQYHAVMTDRMGLEFTKSEKDEGLNKAGKPVAPGEEVEYERFGTLREVGRYKMFSAIAKDASFIAPVPPKNWIDRGWKTLTVETDEDGSYVVHFPEGCVSEEEGSYFAVDVRIPPQEPNTVRELAIKFIKPRDVPDAEKPDSEWQRRWREHFQCEAPVDKPVLYEFYLEGAPTTEIALSN